MSYSVVGRVSVTKCDEGNPRNWVARSNRSPLLSVSSIVKLPTAAPMKALIVKGLRLMESSLSSKARKKAS